MVTSFYDSRGNIRYHLGAQVDVSGPLKGCAGLGSSIRELVTRRRGQSETYARYSHREARDLRASKGVLGVLAEMFTFSELKIVRGSGDTRHDRHTKNTISGGRSSSGTDNKLGPSRLLVRPYPSLKILFVSHSLRVPGLSCRGLAGRDTVAQAFRNGDGITIKIQWLTCPIVTRRGVNFIIHIGRDHRRSRWVHTAPFFGVNVWMVVIVDGEEKQKLSSAPPTGLSNIEKIRLFDLRAGIENRSTSTT
ncbi:hypothetical protein F5Y08DRAFT_336517 [Xylaria arbuscula]|nr:hypothetical protein F5Y08DRAFT_336517 [Xylaria arbuscula]